MQAITKEVLLERKSKLEEQRKSVIEQANAQISAISGALALVDDLLKEDEETEETERE